MSWPKENVPDEYLEIATKLVGKSVITKKEYLDLCLLAIKLINSGQTTLTGRSNMAMYIANIWLCHENISEDDLLDEIGGQFAVFDIPGTFIIDDDLHKPYWEQLKTWVSEAEEKMSNS